VSDIAPQPVRGADRVDSLLRELRAQGVEGVQRAPRLHERRRPDPGLADLLERGFPRGLLSEVAGPLSSGRTSFVLALIARATRIGEWAAWVEISDAFDPTSAAAAGVSLERTLWARAPSVQKALRATERLLEAGGFASVVLDLSPALGRRANPIQVPGGAWSRLRKRAAEGESALIALGERRSASSFSDLAFELGEARPRFDGVPAFFSGLEGVVAVVRNRAGPGPQHATWKTCRGRVEISAA
jgi:hypothetical protein